MPNKTLVTKREELQAKQKYLARIFEAAGQDLDLALVDELKPFKDTPAKAAEVKRLNLELTALGEEVDGLVALEKAAESVKSLGERLGQAASGATGGVTHPTAGGQPLERPKSLGELLTESAEFKAFNASKGRSMQPVSLPDFDVKVLMTQAAGWAPLPEIRSGFVGMPLREPTVLDAIPQTRTNAASITYMLETTNATAGAIARAEGANNAAEAQFVLTATNVVVREFAVWIPVTREQMEDVPQVQGYLNNRLSLQLRQTMSAAILTGAGAPSFTGLIGMGGINTEPLGVNPRPDAVYRAMTQIRVNGFAEPSACVFHPNDWQNIRLLRTVDGIYIWGSPADPGPARIWGLPVVQDTACTATNAIVADFSNFVELATRLGITIEVSDSHAGLFIQRTLAVLATLRAALIVYRPLAITQVTGL